MRTWLRAACAAILMGLMAPSVVLAAPGHHPGKPQWNHGHRWHHGKPKPGLPPIDTSEAQNCDFIAEPDNTLCMLPFPDDYYTVRDPSSPTGRRIDFKTAGMPANVLGTRISADAYNASDGFSQGATILVKVPGIETVADVRATGAVPINHIGRYRKGNAPVVVIDTTTGKRWPIWVEIDSLAGDPSKAALEIHPATNFAAGHRYIVALRNLRNAAGDKIEAPAAFRYYRDKVPSKQPEIEARRRHFEAIFKRLQQSGISRHGLYLAWDFTVASDVNNAGRVLAMRNAAFAQLGDTNLADGSPQGVSPSFQVNEVEEDPFPGEIARRIKGTFEVPCYLFPNCGPGGTMQLGPGSTPTQNGTWTANFDCIVPESALSGSPQSARLSLYGHGLFGSADEVASAPQRSLAQAHDIVTCATDEIGMSESDVPVAISALQELSRFPAIPDRLQQGLLDELFLGRAMISSSGFTAAPAFHQDGTTASPSRPHRAGTRLHQSIAGCAGDELLGAAAALGRLRPLRRRPLPLLPRRNGAAAGPRPDPDALGPRRAEWLRAPDHRQPAARHAGPPGADGRRLWRPPGERLPGRRRGADDRSARSPAGPLSGPLAGHRRPLERPDDPPLPVHRLGDLLLGQRADPRRPGQPGDPDRHRAAAV
jgi:hypothetical protein